MDAVTGEYTYVLENVTTDGIDDADIFHYSILNDNGETSQAGLTIDIEDDRPIFNELNHTVIVEPVFTNLIIFFDRSGSMRWQAQDGDGNNIGRRIDIARNALDQLFSTYELLGPVNIKIIDFASNVNETGWFDNATDAMTYLNSLTPEGWTRYDDALSTLVSGYAPPAGADQTIAYFLSDGDPRPAPSEVNQLTAYEAAWVDFVDTNSVDQVYAVGIGDGVSSTYLDIVSHPAMDPAGNDATLIVTDESQLVSQLVETVDQTLHGDITADGSTGAGITIGADGGRLETIQIDGTTYNYDQANPEISVNTDHGGLFLLNFDTGNYSYVVGNRAGAPGTSFQETVRVTVIDGDGDIVGGTLTIDVIFPTTAGTGGDDFLIYDELPLDGLGGFDTLVLPNGGDLDLNMAASQIDNIERIDLSSGDHGVINLDIADLLDITGTGILQITGDAEDNVLLSESGWSKSDSIVTTDGSDFFTYSNGTASVLIEDTITDVSFS